MRREHVRDLLQQVADGSLDVEHALDALAFEPVESLGFATIDHHRALRQGFPEVIYGAGKTPEQICEIATRIAARGDGVLVTRCRDDAARVARVERCPASSCNRARAHRASARRRRPAPPATGTVAIVTAGHERPAGRRGSRGHARRAGQLRGARSPTSASPESIVCSRSATSCASAAVVIVIAGMDGALPSVVGGLVRAPVIAVPTSVGYGASFQGIAPLLTMLNSCAAGVTVVNIDNGFGAAVAASRITHGIG